MTIYGPEETDIRIEMYGALLSDLVDKENVHALPLTTSIVNFLIFCYLHCYTFLVSIFCCKFLETMISTATTTTALNDICQNGGVHLSGMKHNKKL